MVARPTTRCPDISEELPGEDSATIRVESLTKIDGPKEARAAALLRQGLSREEIRRTTAATVAVEDVSFSVRAGETFVERKTLCAIESNHLGRRICRYGEV
jgi:hypothetical protein